MTGFRPIGGRLLHSLLPRRQESNSDGGKRHTVLQLGTSTFLGFGIRPRYHSKAYDLGYLLLLPLVKTSQFGRVNPRWKRFGQKSPVLYFG